MNYLTYGAGGKVDPRVIQLLEQMLAQQGYADGGPPQLQSQVSPYVDTGTGAPGRADNIDAKLSEKEYVLDAEFMALLGDGNPDAGALKMDKFRENVRRHKGEYLTHGKISPDALDPMEYLDVAPVKKAGGGKVVKSLARIKSFVTKTEGRDKVDSMYKNGLIDSNDRERLLHEVNTSSAPDHVAGGNTGSLPDYITRKK